MRSEQAKRPPSSWTMGRISAGNHRDNVEDHPFERVSGLAEGLDDLKALDYCAPSSGSLVFLSSSLSASESSSTSIAGKQLLYRLGAHADAELVFVYLAVFLILLFAQQPILLFKGSRAGVDNDVLGEIQHLLELLRRNVEHESHARGGRLEVPDMRHRSGKLDMTHPLASHLFAS